MESLPDTVVSANTIDTFKARLDRFWSDQEVKYNGVPAKFLR